MTAGGAAGGAATRYGRLSHPIFAMCCILQSFCRRRVRVVAHPKIRENRQFVTDESVEFRNNWLKFKTAGNLVIM
jgi:hypothetical protein